MKSRRPFIWLAVLLTAIFTGAIWWSNLQQAGELRYFTERLQVRNPNNTGPVKRAYLVTCDSLAWDAMQSYGDLQLHNKYGHTTVFFFLTDNPIPASLELGAQPFSEEFYPFCVARYQKLALGQVRFETYPFRGSQ
ncbi:MAG: hypothetical protein AAF804_15880 [Bacteroidota bacterium]